MRNYLHSRDAELAASPLALLRTVGKKAKPRAVRTAAERAELKQPEADIHTALEMRIEASGKPYVSLREHHYGWLRAMWERGHDEAKELLDILKDLPDLTVYEKDPASPWTRCLLLEMKRKTGSAKPGQRRLALAAGGTIAKGESEAVDVLERFLTKETH